MTELNRSVMQDQPHILETLRQAVRLPSVENKGEKGTPFGVATRDSLRLMLQTAESFGFRTKNIDDICGWCEWGSGDEMVAVLGHLDVVPAADGWHYPPFELTEDGGRLYGRGVSDDKGPCVAALYALKAIAAAGVGLNRRIRLIFGTNEETGCACMEHYVQSGEELPVMGFTPDAQYPVINGEKGIVTATYQKLLVKKGACRILAMEGGVAPNVVPDKAWAHLGCEEYTAAKLLQLKLPGITLERVPKGIKVTAFGRSAHGSTPEKGVNAIGKLMEALLNFPLQGDDDDFVRFVSRHIGLQTRGERLGIALHDEVSGDLVVNLGMLRYDDQNVRITLNIRYPVTMRLSDFSGTLFGAMSVGGFSQISFSHMLPLYYPPKSPLVSTLCRVYAEQTGENLPPFCIGGGTYAKTMPNVVAFGAAFPDDPQVEHQPDEFVQIDHLMKSACIMAHAMVALAQQ